MKLVILAGGYGTRLSEETKKKPKPLVEIGGMPIIWHLMKIYSHYGINDFIICLGYKGNLLKKKISQINRNKNEGWNINYVNTGLNTMTGGRIKRIKKFLNGDKIFCLSYGDGLSDVNILKLINYHRSKGKIATLTAVKQFNRFGVLEIKNNYLVKEIKEKPKNYINGGFFILSKKIFKYLKNDKTIFEKDCLPKICEINQLAAFKHEGFWACMDTLREKKELNRIWKNKKVSWKVWK